jgi:hypothetical protein
MTGSNNMKCQDYSQLISAHLDGYLSLNEEVRLEAHLVHCAGCRQQSEGMQELRRDMRTMRSQAASPRMVSDIAVALQFEAKAQAKAARAREDRREAWRIRLFGQSIGLAVSLVMLFFLSAEILSPINRTMVIARATEASESSEDSEQFNQLSRMLMPPPPSRPNFSPSGGLLGFTEASPEGEFIIAVSVDQTGRACVTQVVETPPQNDSAMLVRLTDALTHQASFTPAKRKGQYIISDAILLFSKVNIQG